MLRIILCLLLATSTHAAIIGVPGEHSTIQAALDVSASGDTVLVERGTYPEHLTTPEHGVTVMSRYMMTRDSADWLDTILDGTHSGTCVFLPTTHCEWTRFQGLVIANGRGEVMAGGIVSQDSICLELRHIILRDHQAIQASPTLAAASAIRLRGGVHRLTISNMSVSNAIGDNRENIFAGVNATILLDSLDFNGDGDSGCAGHFSSQDTLIASHIRFHDYEPSSRYSSLWGTNYTSIRDVEIADCRGNYGAMFIFGDGYSILRNIHVHDCVHTGTGQDVNAAVLIISSDYVDLDSMIVENTTMRESDAIEIERYPNGDPNQPVGEVNHLIVRNNFAGGIDAYPHEYSGRIASILHCSLRNSIFTGNTTDLPYAPDDSTGVSLRRGSTLFMKHNSLDSLIIENVEISHNVVIDHDDHWALINTLGPEFVLGNLGRALYLSLNQTDVTVIRDCIFHDNRLNNFVPETDFYWSL
ncbi:MAG: hypothetical protein KDC10_15660 [Calditrichaeota bacterium]|nr:hypothetical protein [Calditrichota bacterium]